MATFMLAQLARNFRDVCVRREHAFAKLEFAGIEPPPAALPARTGGGIAGSAGR
jgi:hypothetical protein